MHNLSAQKPQLGWACKREDNFFLCIWERSPESPGDLIGLRTYYSLVLGFDAAQTVCTHTRASCIQSSSMLRGRQPSTCRPMLHRCSPRLSIRTGSLSYAVSIRCRSYCLCFPLKNNTDSLDDFGVPTTFKIARDAK